MCVVSGTLIDTFMCALIYKLSGKLRRLYQQKNQGMG